jgi:hypothetical protein
VCQVSIASQQPSRVAPLTPDTSRCCAAGSCAPSRRRAWRRRSLRPVLRAGTRSLVAAVRCARQATRAPSAAIRAAACTALRSRSARSVRRACSSSLGLRWQRAQGSGSRRATCAPTRSQQLVLSLQFACPWSCYDALHEQPFAHPRGSGTCVVVCAANFALSGGVCTPCPAGMFALWNATSVWARAAASL